MKTFRRIILFCSFAILGVGLAVCVGLSITTPADQQASEPQKPPAELAIQPPSEQEPLSQPRAANLVAPWPSMSVPSSPLAAVPYPARAQQFIPEAGKARLERIYQYVEEQLASDADPAAPQQMPEAPTEGNPGQSPAGPTGPDSEAPASKATIEGEGDDKLLIHIPPDTDIRDVLDQLAEYGNLNILAGSGVQGKVSATLSGVDVEGALDAILKSTGLVARREGKFIFVGTPADFDTLEQAMDKIGTRVYRPNYVTAAELNTLVTPLLTADVGFASVSSPANVGIESDDTADGGDNFASGDVVVVRDYEAVLAEIDQVVDEIDVRPMQVAIEAMILGVRLSDGNEFGVNFEFLRNTDHAKLGWGRVPENKEALETSETILNDTVDTATLAAIGGLSKVLLDGGLKFGFLDDNLGVFVNALESMGDTNVIATPRLLVLNKQRAEIHIGGEEGYRGSLSTTETSSTQGVEMLETGTRLRLRPFISSDGMIRMEVHPELSNGEVRAVGNDTLPIKTTTQVTTNIMVRDGCTVVIGGLLDEELVTTTTQIPLLGNLPVVGVAFRNKSETI
ncbi:MAG: secretin and TonB N-terminal domain-containing protein, partial [Planctomycetota bacterium]